MRIDEALLIRVLKMMRDVWTLLEPPVRFFEISGLTLCRQILFMRVWGALEMHPGTWRAHESSWKKRSAHFPLNLERLPMSVS